MVSRLLTDNKCSNRKGCCYSHGLLLKPPLVAVNTLFC